MAEVFRIEIKGMRKVLDYLRRLSGGGIKQADDKAREELAKHLRDEVRKEYQSANYELTEGTREAYSHGKLAGSTPARLQWTGVSLLRSGVLARSVIHKKEADVWKVMIDPKARYGGDPADAARGVTPAYIASQLENPQPMIVQITEKMLAYLHVIRPAASKGTSAGTAKVGGFIKVQPKAKPVWAPVFKRAKSALPTYVKVFHKHLLNPQIR